MRSFPLDGVMVTPLASKFPRATYEVAHPWGGAPLNVTVAFDLAEPEAKVLDVLRRVVTSRLHIAVKTDPGWGVALHSLVVPE